MGGDIVRRFEYHQGRKALYKHSPFVNSSSEHGNVRA